MSHINDHQINNIMNLNETINNRKGYDFNSFTQPLNPNIINLSCIDVKHKNACNKKITFSSVEQFIHYKMTGRKPHPKVKFIPQEDELLRNLVQEYGENDNWSIIAKKMTITYRNQRQCKERWFNYLSPNINNTPFTHEEDNKLEELYAEYGAKWVQIAKYFPSRTDINIRSRWLVLQRRKKKTESKQPSDEASTSPTFLNSDIDNVQNHPCSKNTNLPVPQIKQNSPIQTHDITRDSIFPFSFSENTLQNSSSEIIENETNSSTCENMFSMEDEKSIFNEENFFNITPVELSTNDLNSFEDWSF